MSAGQGDALIRPDPDCSKLAPRFRQAVEAAILECNIGGLDAYVFEAFRSQATQAAYYARGRTVLPPPKPVTNAPSSLYSWHGYGLAVDVISRSQQWAASASWYSQVAAVFRKHGCAWGGEWKQRDLPHFQWAACKPSPSDLAREIMNAQGVQAVWQAVGAQEAGPPTAAHALQPSGAISASAGASTVIPADIGKLQLNDNARNAAMILRARFPFIVFTSGRRSIQSQAEAMAADVLKDRRFIATTYKPSALCQACQEWVDAHPEVRSQAAIAEGLSGVFGAVGEAEVMKFSKHLTGDAFDVEPVPSQAQTITSFIRRLPLLEEFLTQEGQLLRWHLQFYR